MKLLNVRCSNISGEIGKEMILSYLRKVAVMFPICDWKVGKVLPTFGQISNLQVNASVDML